MRSATFAVVLLVGCGGTVDPVLTRGALPAACIPPAFEVGQCVAETLNDGTGPDDHRTVCKVEGEPDGESDPVFCHLGGRWDRVVAHGGLVRTGHAPLDQGRDLRKLHTHLRLDALLAHPLVGDYFCMRVVVVLNDALNPQSRIER